MAILKKNKKESTAEKKQTLQDQDKKEGATEKKVVSVPGNSQILVRPLLSEKTTMLESSGQYSFHVTPQANKIEVKKAIVSVYGVQPTRVNIVNVEGKKKRSGKIAGRRMDWKKAIVTLKKGDKIDIHEGV